MIASMRDYWNCHVSAVSYRLPHGLADVKPFNPFYLNMNARQPSNIWRIKAACKLLPSPNIIIAFGAAEGGKFPFAAPAF
jgi:hypothetical protein